MVAAAVRTVFAQPDAVAVAEQFERITIMLDGQFPDVASALRDTREELLAFSSFPPEHWRKIW
jgi:putative transposase